MVPAKLSFFVVVVLVFYLLQTRDHLSKAQRGLVGDGVSEVMTKLRVTSSDGTSYSGDLLAIIDVLKNMTEIFRRSYYSPSNADMRVGEALFA